MTGLPASLHRCAGWLIACAAGAALDATAFTVTISSGPRSLYMVVGNGTMSGRYDSGGTPGNNATINTVTASVSAANLGAGPVAMTTNSSTTNSLYDNYVFCSVPTQVYVAGFFRAPGTVGSASLTVTAPANLVSGSNTLPFNTISWQSGGNGDAVPTIPSGSFIGGASQNLLAVPANTWFESCLAFSYANGSLPAAGTYTGRATYTLTAP
ncbi:MAG: hypothetical protein K9J82_15955 [Methylotenera sp.]|jgi:hypothetical protein|nr:hypothetical protein [Methylotenera sp.]